MTVDELRARFPEIPGDLAGEPLLAEYAEAFDPLLRKAVKPSPCMKDVDAPHIFYTTLVMDMAIYGMRLAKKEKTLGLLQSKVDAFRANPVKYACGLVPHKPRGTASAGCPE